MESQRQSAEYQARDQCQPLALLQFALRDEERSIDDHRAGNQHRRSTVDTPQLEAVAGQIDYTRVHLVNDEEQQKRDEIDELFHSGSQDRM